MLIWNVAGAKKKTEETWKYIRSFDIIGLTETWIEVKEKHWIHKKLQGYTVKNIPAVRLKRRGRVKGGLVLAIRKGIEVLEEEIGNIVEVKKELAAVKLRLDGKDIYYILTYMRENRNDNWNEIEKIVERGIGEIILLGGDFNARTANEGGNIDEGHRQKK